VADLKPYFRRRSRPAADRVDRSAISAWFSETRSSAVRIVCATVGTGKSVAVQQYVDRRDGAAAYIRIPAGATASDLRTIVAAGSEFEEVVLDDVDRAAPEAYRALLDDIIDGTIEQRLVLTGRSRRRLATQALVARGLAAACDARLLAFDRDELAALAALMGVEHDEHDVAQLLHDTDGWAIASHWLIREAAEGSRPLRDAFPLWRERNGHLLLEFVEQETYEAADAVATFRGLLRRDWTKEPDQLEQLEQLGLPIVRTRSGLRPYRILADLASPTAAESAPLDAAAGPPLMTLSTFGRFRCEIGGNGVTFARRRDQQVLTFVALAPEGRTTRDRLLDVFWSGNERSLGAQGLRTALSRIRRAIAQAAPGVDPDRYFRTAGEIRIDDTLVSVDARRFIDHCEQARLDDAAGSTDAAKRHYRIAYRVYRDRLLHAEAPEPCFTRLADDFESRYVAVLERLYALHDASGEQDAARDYARILAARQGSEARRRAIDPLDVRPITVPA